jgi:hypothetical protein
VLLFGFLTNITKRKAPADPGERPSWDRIKPQPFTVSTKEFLFENKTARTKVSPYKAYENLRTDSQREAIDRLINNYKANEQNPHAVWEIAYIKANRAPIPGTWGRAEETKDIRVIFKRSPLPYGQQPNPQFAHFPFGKIIDTTVEEPFPVTMQKNQQQQQNQQAQQRNPQQQQQQQQQQHQGQFNMPPQMNGQLQPTNGQPPLNGQSPPMNGQPPPTNGQLPPPPNKPPPFGTHPPPLPPQGHPPHMAMQGSRPNSGANAPVTQIFNIAQPERAKKQKSTKAKSDRLRSTSPRSRQPFRESMDAIEKVKTWNPTSSDSEDNSDSGSSVAASPGYTHRSKKYQKDRYKATPPPIGPYASGAQRSSSRLSHNLMRETSLKELRGRNKRSSGRKTTERYRSSDNNSDDDYEFVNHPPSHRRRHETPPTSVDSESTRSSRRDSGEYKNRLTRYSQHERSRSRSRTHYDRRPRRSRSRSLSRARYDTLDRMSSIREHRQPDAYQGLSPPPDAQKPVIVHIHNGTNNNDRYKTSMPQHQAALHLNRIPSPDSSLLLGLSLDEYGYTDHIAPMPRALSHPTTNHYPILPHASVAPAHQSLKTQAAQECRRSLHHRSKLVDIDDYERQRAGEVRRERDELIRKQRAERDRAVHISMPRGHEYTRRPERGLCRDNDFSLRTENDWTRPPVPRRNNGVRFGGDYDTRDNFHFSRSTYV